MNIESSDEGSESSKRKERDDFKFLTKLLGAEAEFELK